MNVQFEEFTNAKGQQAWRVIDRFVWPDPDPEDTEIPIPLGIIEIEGGKPTFNCLSGYLDIPALESITAFMRELERRVKS